MATRMNMLKLVQEIRGLAEFPNWPPPSRPEVPPPLQVSLPKLQCLPPDCRRVRQILVRESVDLPHPVPIKYRVRA